MGPAIFKPGSGIDVIPHPHINLATITYLFEGEIVHRDSIGSVQSITPGAINLMVAGKGIVHSERTRRELRATGHRSHGLQLWMALPEEYEETEPSFHHYRAEDIPSSSVNGINLRVMIGTAFGLTSPVRTFSPAIFAEAAMPASTVLTLDPDQDERGVYLVSGSVRADGEKISQPGMIIFKPKLPVTVTALGDSRVVVIGGENLGERYMWWNFASSKKNRIETAKSAWKNGLMGKVPNETGLASLPESDSFSAMGK